MHRIKKPNILLFTTHISVIIVALSLLILTYNKPENVIETNTGPIAIMLETEPGVYTKSQSSDWPTDDEYVYDSEKSYCVNGSDLIWKINKLTIKSNGPDKCYAYFKNVDSIPNEISERILDYNGGRKSIEKKDILKHDYIIQSNEGMQAMADNYGTSYYFVGAVDNNWVYFAGFYWRIVRINGDSSVKLIYTGDTKPTENEKVKMTGANTNIGVSAFNTLYDKPETNGYMYTLNQHRGHGNDSTIKKYIDDWYEDNLLDYEEYLSDFIVCSDRSYPDNYIPIGRLPYDTKNTITYTRLSATHNPNLICPHKEDSYTKDDIVYGNGQLKYPIGLLTADEARLAGGHGTTGNLSYYLYTNDMYWLLSPQGVNVNYSFNFLVYPVGVVSFYSVDFEIGVRPVISLLPDTYMIGSGKWDDPYKVITAFNKTILADNGGKKGIDLKTTTNPPSFNNIAPLIEAYKEVTDTYTSSMSSNGNKAIGTDYSFNQLSGNYTLINYLTNQTYSQNSVGKYTCNSNSYSNCATMYKINIVTGSRVTNSTRYTSEAIFDYSETGMYKMEDDYGKSYYFRGAVDNNWVKFGKENSNDIWWRIVRINGDGAVKLLYTGTTGPKNSNQSISITGASTQAKVGNSRTTAFNTFSNKPGYIGYMYTLNEHRGHGTPSTIKNFIDTWYEEHFLNTDYEDYLSDFIVCNDRGFLGGYEPKGDIMPNEMHYSNTRNRLNTNKNPKLTCPHEDDAYTKDDIVKGNGKLDYKIGLLTADEAALAGGKWWTENRSYYLYTNSTYWLINPADINQERSSNFLLSEEGYVSNYNVDWVVGVRPVISIKPSTLVYGSGKWDDPYIVLMD